METEILQNALTHGGAMTGTAGIMLLMIRKFISYLQSRISKQDRTITKLEDRIVLKDSELKRLNEDIVRSLSKITDRPALNGGFDRLVQKVEEISISLQKRKK